MRQRAWLSALITALVVAMAGIGLNAAPAQAATPVTYAATQTIPVPPASAYQGSGGGDGWNIALSDRAVYNVFHHAPSLTVACHLQADASECWSPKTLTGPNGESFAVSSHSTVSLNGNKLYVFATRSSDSSVGVACFDTTKADASTDPFCGFTALTAASAGTQEQSMSQVSMAASVGTKRYAFNYVNGQSAPGPGGVNQLLCFDLATNAGCPGQPYSPAQTGNAQVSVTTYPTPSVVAAAGRILIGLNSDNLSPVLACFDTATNASCVGNWPAAVPQDYLGGAGAPFPMLDSTGKTTGFCLPTTGDPCYTLTGASAPTPAGLVQAVPPTSGWNGPAAIIGTRVYIPDGNRNQVSCYDYSAGASCANFPHLTANSSLTYTVNPDPQRPACLWTNADNGSAQLQNFDVYSGNACGEGPVRVLASSFVVDTNVCQPATYTSLQVTDPTRSAYSDGYVQFRDGNGSTINGVGDRTIDAAGEVDLSGLSLSTASGLPQFLITLNTTNGRPGAVGVKLTWTGVDDPSCVKPGTVVTGGGAPSSCPDAFFIAMLGSGQYYKSDQDLTVSPQLNAMYNAMLTKTGNKTVRKQVVNYPATSVDALWTGLSSARNKVALVSKLSANIDSYLAGEKSGVTKLSQTIAGDEASCPNSKIVLGGYSQGAMTIHDWANNPNAGNHPNVVGIGLLADPERVDKSAVLNFGSAEFISKRFIGSHGVCAQINALKNCATPQSLTDVSSRFASRSVQVCEAYDLVCDTGTVVSTYIVNTKQGRETLLNLAKFVHGTYTWLPATKTAGKWLGLRVIR